MTLHQLCERVSDEDVPDVAVSDPALHCLFARAEPAFTPLERQAIALGARDTLASLEPPGRLARLVAWAFGLRAAPRLLADPRLETLRRAAVVTRHRHHLPDAAAAELRLLGYGPERVGELEALAIG